MRSAPLISAIICTHNPRLDYFERTLNSLRAQEDLGQERCWELLVVDNASAVALQNSLDLSWHPDARVIREAKLGLTHARLRSFHESRGKILVYIDDDNVLDPDYLRLVADAFDADPTLGAIGGKSIAKWETPPPSWFPSVGISLACRDLGETRIQAAWKGKETERYYPECAPVGAGMAVLKKAYAAYVRDASQSEVRTSLGRRGADLASGEDNDMVLSILAQGWSIAYIPELRLEHLIPAHRLTSGYLERYAQSSSRTWVQVLAVHGILPWTPIARWTLPLRKARAWLRLCPGQGEAGRIRWRAACGTFDGRALLASMEDVR